MREATIYIEWRGKKYSVKDIAERADVVYATALAWINKYKDGEMTLEEIMVGKVSEDTSRGSGEWGRLSSRVRNENLAKIPKMTAIEKKLWGKLPASVDGSASKFTEVD